MLFFTNVHCITHLKNRMLPYCNFYVVRKSLLGYINCKRKSKVKRRKMLGKTDVEGMREGRQQERQKGHIKIEVRKEIKNGERTEKDPESTVCIFPFLPVPESSV